MIVGVRSILFICILVELIQLKLKNIELQMFIMSYLMRMLNRKQNIHMLNLN